MHKLSGGLAFVVCAALVAAGCGTTNKSPKPGPQQPAKRGGNVTLLSVGDVSTLDPGQMYYLYDYQVIWHPTQRSLYGWQPGATAPSPDLAAAMPRTSADGKTVTIKLKPDIRYSPPLQKRTVKSADVKYAIERGFLGSVGTPYASLYYGKIVGAARFRDGKADEITGIQTPDDTTLVLKLSAPIGLISTGQSLALPLTVPVPKDYAQRYDKGRASTYGKHQVFTGPYMIANDGKGTITGYKPKQRIDLVRNPSWDPKTDYRPAYLDTITVRGGNDIGVASRKILSGEGLVNGDFSAPPVNVLRTALATRKDQLAITPAQGVRYVALNTTVKPFDNVDVRRAVAAAIDRTRLRLTRGGPTLGPLATHFLPPDIPGFEEAGGAAGNVKVMQNPKADLTLAHRLMRKAGYASGRYSGPPLTMVGETDPPASNTAEAVQNQLEKLGFTFDFKQLPTVSMQDSCGTPERKIAVCPNGAWGKDFFDPQSLLEPVFSGHSITPGASSPNWSEIDDPELTADFDLAVGEADPDKRAQDYADIDRTVTERAYVVPWLWDNQINLASDDVQGPVNKFTAAWDLSYMSRK